MCIDKLQKNIFYQKYWFHLIANLLFFIVASLLLPIRFETNDDVMMLLISSGAYTGTPDAHLVYMNYIYGLFLNMLYAMVEGVEWYTICLSAIHIISLSILSWKITTFKASNIWKILGLAILYLLEIQLLIRFQYTSTAALCSTAAVVLFLTGNKGQKYLASLLFLLATMIRFDPAYLAFLIFIPLIIYFILKQQGKIKILLPLSLFVVLSVGAYIVDKTIYEGDPVWKDYKEFNYYRGRISDNPNSERVKGLQTDLNQSDFYLLRRFFPDVKVVTNEKLKNISEDVKAVDFKLKVENIYDESASSYNLSTYKVALLLILFFSLFLVVMHEDRVKKGMMLLTTTLLFLSLCYVTLDGFLWYRVLYSALLPYCLVVIYLCSSLIQRKNVWVIASLLIVITLFLEGRMIYNQKRENRRYVKMNLPTKTEMEINSTRESLRNAKGLLREGEYLINFDSALKLEILSPFSISSYFRDNQFVILSWLSKSPHNVGLIDSFRELVGANVICMEKRQMEDCLVHLKNSILLNYGIEVDADILYEDDVNILFRLEERI